MDLQVGVLGPVEARRDGEPLPLGGRKQRCVLAVLACTPDRHVSVDALVDAVWGEAGGDRQNTLQVYVSTLRRVLGRDDHGASLITSAAAGYRLHLAEEQVDAVRFLGLATQARQDLAAGRPDTAARGLREALALWRGPALGDLGDDPWAQPWVARWNAARHEALADRIDADLALGADASLVPELEQLVREHPADERFWGQLMTALYRAGRQADALRAWTRARRTLREEFGLDPGPACAPSNGPSSARTTRSRPPRTRATPATPGAPGNRATGTTRTMQTRAARARAAPPPRPPPPGPRPPHARGACPGPRPRCAAATPNARAWRSCSRPVPGW
ncbi:MAG: AfsR/SARP family transcriptional regulator [Kineosporiaceae bacterium]